jgi:hypothetical protein
MISLNILLINMVIHHLATCHHNKGRQQLHLLLQLEAEVLVKEIRPSFPYPIQFDSFEFKRTLN